MTTINFLLSDGENSEWREVNITNTIIIDLSNYIKSKDITDIQVENEGSSNVFGLEKDGNVRYVYDNPGAPTLPPKQNKPWLMFG